MARVRLRDTETRPSRLPEVCVVCGESTEKFTKRIFTWYPRWSALLLLLGFFPGAIMMLVLTKRMTVHVPFCQAHRRYFQTRGLLMWLPLLGFIVLTVLGLFLPYLFLEPDVADTARPVMWIVLGVCLVLAILTVVILLNTGIRPAEITEESITLIGVNDEFADALDDLRDERRRSRQDEDDEDDDDRPRRRSRREDDEDDDRPRQRPQAKDDDRPRRQSSDDEHERPRQKRRDDAEDAGDRPPRRRMAEEDEDRPRRSRRDNDVDADDRPARPGNPRDDDTPRKSRPDEQE
jgi:hypothetical protein